MHEKGEREGELLPQGGGSGGSRIGPSVTTQSKSCGSLRNPPFVTSFLCKFLLFPREYDHARP